MSTKAALEKAIAHFGNQRKMADAIGCQQGSISSWLRITERCPAEWAIPIEKACKGVVTRYELRPDIYPLQETG